MTTGGIGCSAQGLLARGLALHEELLVWGGTGSARLLKLVRAELAFVNRLAGVPVLSPSCPELRSSNFDHIEAVLRILQHPFVRAVSAVMQNFAVTASDDSADEQELLKEDLGGAVAHVDIVCMFNGKPVWLVVSTRNPRYINWYDLEKHMKGLRSRLRLLLNAACADPAMQPTSILLCFIGDVDGMVDRGLRDEFGAVRANALGEQRNHLISPSISLESSMVVLDSKDIPSQDDCSFSEVEGGEWLDVEVNGDVRADITASVEWVTYEVDVAVYKETSYGNRGLSNSCCSVDASLHGDGVDGSKLDMGEDECAGPDTIEWPPESDDHALSVVSSHHDDDTNQTRCQSVADEQGVINLDTTALVALVSEVSNGGAEHLLSLPYEDMVKRFPSMATFIHKQALSELDRPLAADIEYAIAHRQPVISQHVHDEFSSIVSLVGGPREKERAKKLLERVRVVEDSPSSRVMALPLTGKIKNRHKVVFGTGDQLSVPTLTANMAFVRAARQKGMAIEIVEHRPRALTGD